MDSEAQRIIGFITTKQLPLNAEDLATAREFYRRQGAGDNLTILNGSISPDLRTDWLDTSLAPKTRACHHTHLEPEAWQRLMEFECMRTVCAFLDRCDNEKKIVSLLMWRAALAYCHALYQHNLHRTIRVCHTEAKRDEQTLKVTSPMPLSAEDKGVFFGQDVFDEVIIPDPMLASGVSTAFSIRLLNEFGVPNRKITVLCVVAAPEGIFHILNQYPGVKIIAATVDGRLNEDAYIVEDGLGDAGDKYFRGNSLESFERMHLLFNKKQWARLRRLLREANK